MAIASYPRVAVEGTTATNNPPNGQSLMLFNSTTQQYEPATAATFAGGGGGGGDASASNQSIQIAESQQTNNLLFNTPTGSSVADILEDIRINKLTNSVGNSVARILDYIDSKTTNIEKYSKFNTYYSKVFYDEGGNDIDLKGAVKIVFNQNSSVSVLEDINATDVLTQYLSSPNPKKEVYVGTEIICNLAVPSDKFDKIRLGGGGAFTAYYLLNPNV